jgi:hypothetical protein
MELLAVRRKCEPRNKKSAIKYLFSSGQSLHCFVIGDTCSRLQPLFQKIMVTVHYILSVQVSVFEIWSLRYVGFTLFTGHEGPEGE